MHAMLSYPQLMTSIVHVLLTKSEQEVRHQEVIKGSSYPQPHGQRPRGSEAIRHKFVIFDQVCHIL